MYIQIKGTTIGNKNVNIYSESKDSLQDSIGSQSNRVSTATSPKKQSRNLSIGTQVPPCMEGLVLPPTEVTV
jgi:hypothetical protein